MADTALTISSSRVTRLSNQEAAAVGYNFRAKVKYSDVNTGTGNADTVTLTLGSTPAKWLVTSAMVNVKTAFAGTTAFTLKVGATDDDFAIASTSVMTAGIIQPSTGANTVAAPSGATGTAAQTIKAIFTNATGGSPSALSAGELDIYLNIVDTAQLG